MRAAQALFAAAAALLTACTAEEIQSPPGYQEPDRRLCQAEGGRIQPTLLPSVRVCVKPFADAGKKCSDGSQCMGSCLITEKDADWDDDLTAGQDASGHCQGEDPFLGCYIEIEQGKTKQAICAD